QAGAVVGADLDDGGGAGRVVHDHHAGRRGPRARAPADRPGAPFEPLGDVEAAGEHAAQVGLKPGRVGRRPELGDGGEVQDGGLAGALRGGRRRRGRHRAGGLDGEAVQRENAGRAPEQAGTVGRGDGDAGPGDADGGAVVAHEGQQAGAEDGGGRRRPAGQRGGGAAGELGDEPGLPGAPGGGAGGGAVGDREGGEQVDDLAFAAGHRGDRGGDGLHGDGIVDVAAGGGLGQQQVVADERLQDGDVLFGEAEACCDVAGDDRAGGGVVAGPALADVVQERAHEGEVGAGDVAGEGGGARGGLHEVAVDGEPVHGVALGAVADAFPVGQQPDDQSGLVERLPDADGGGPGAEQGHERVAGGGGPRLPRQGGVFGEAGHGGGSERQARLGGRGGDTENERGVVEIGAPGQHDLALVLDGPVPDRPALHPAPGLRGGDAGDAVPQVGGRIGDGSG